MNKRPAPPATYSSTIETNKKYDEVRMEVLQGGSKGLPRRAAYAPQFPTGCRSRMRTGVACMDPMTASILPVPGNGSTFVPQACDRNISIFDGRMRYDLNLTYKRLDKVKSEKGYQGTVVVFFERNSFRLPAIFPTAPSIKYLIDLRWTSSCGSRRSRERD